METNLKAYIEQITGQSSIRQIAQEIGVPQTTLSYQWRGNMQPSMLASICRAYSAPILPAFVLAGFLTKEDAESFSAIRDIKVVSDEELANEVLRRMQSGRKSVLEESFEDNVQKVDFKRSTDGDYGEEPNYEKMTARKIDTPKLGADDS